MKKIYKYMIYATLFIFVILMMLAMVQNSEGSSNLRTSGTYSNFSYYDMSTGNINEFPLVFREPTDDNNYRYEIETGFTDYGYITAQSNPINEIGSYVINQFEITSDDINAYNTYDNDYDGTFDTDSYEQIVVNGVSELLEFESIGTGSQSSYTSGYNSHLDVINIYDTSSLDNVIYARNIEKIESGTIELWFCIDSISSSAEIIEIMSSNNFIFSVGVDSTNAIKVYHNGGTTTVKTWTQNQWYHLRIDFECGSGGYEGLSADDFKIYIDGLHEGTFDFDNNVNFINIHYFGIKTNSFTGSFYLDAISYSWNTIRNGKINNQFEHYGTFSFENDIIGSTPNDWNDYSTGNAEVIVINDNNYHNSIIKISDPDASSTIDCYNDFDNQESGTIEFWLMVNDNTKENYIDLKDGTNYRLNFGVYNGQFFYYTTTYNYLCSFNNNQWYHIRIDFECGSGGYEGLSPDTANIIINGNSYSTTFYSPSTYINRFSLRTSISGYPIYYYLDAFGYSWQNYEIGTNIELGIVNNDITYVGNQILIQDNSDLEKTTISNDFHDGSEGFFKFNMKRYDSSNENTELIFKNSNFNEFVRFRFNDVLEYSTNQGGTYNNIQNSGSGTLSLSPSTEYQLWIQFWSSKMKIIYWVDGLGYQFSSIEYSVNLQAGLREAILQTDIIDDYDFLYEFFEYDDTYNNQHDMNGIITYEYEIGSNIYGNYYDNNGNYGIDIELYAYDSGITHYDYTMITFDITSSSITMKDYWNILDIQTITNSENITGLEKIEIHLHSFIGTYEGYKDISFHYKVEIFVNNDDTSILTYEAHRLLNYDDIIGIETFWSMSLNTANKENYNILTGYRGLYDDDLNSHSDFIDFPFFREFIYITIPEPIDENIPTDNHWKFTQYIIGFYNSENLTTENLHMEYALIEVVGVEGRFYYKQFPTYITGNLFTQWLVDFITWIGNVLLLAVYFIMFCVVVGFNLIVVLLIVGNILIFFWNIILKYLVYAGLLLIELILWLVVDILLPTFFWLLEIGVPWLMAIIIDLIALFVSWTAWAFTGGLIDVVALEQTVNTLFDTLFLFFYDIILMVIEYIPLMLIYVGTYTYYLFWLYIKKIYTKSRGWIERTAQIQNSIDTYGYPFQLFFKWLANRKQNSE